MNRGRLPVPQPLCGRFGRSRAQAGVPVLRCGRVALHSRRPTRHFPPAARPTLPRIVIGRNDPDEEGARDRVPAAVRPSRPLPGNRQECLCYLGPAPPVPLCRGPAVADAPEPLWRRRALAVGRTLFGPTKARAVREPPLRRSPASFSYFSTGISWSSVGCWQQTQLPGSRATMLHVAQK